MAKIVYVLALYSALRGMVSASEEAAAYPYPKSRANPTLSDNMKIATVAARFIGEKFGRDCAIKIMVPNEEFAAASPARDILNQLALRAMNRNAEISSLDSVELRTVSLFEIRNHSSFTADFLDGFLAWSSRCVLNILAVSRLEDAEVARINHDLDFVYKLSSRDRTSHLLLLTSISGEGDSSQQSGADYMLENTVNFLRKRLRNYRSVCIVAYDPSSLENRGIFCLEDPFLIGDQRHLTWSPNRKEARQLYEFMYFS